METFAERLRALRQQAGLTQVDLAGDDLSASYISLLEAGKRIPSRDILGRLAARLGCSIGQLAEGRSSEREERLALEVAYARLAIEHGECADARARLERLVTDAELPRRTRDDALLLLARAHERLGAHGDAVEVLQPLYERSCARASGLPVLDVAISLCHCLFAAGDLHRAAALGTEAMDVARAQGLAGTDDYFRMGATVMSAHYDLGDFTYARLLGRRLAAEAEESQRPAGQAALYWNAAILAEYEGRLGEAVRLCERALARMGELENTRDFARLRLAVAGIFMACDPPDVSRAAALLSRCRLDLADLGSRLDLAEWAYVASAVRLHEGSLAEAEDQARQAVAALEGMTCPERVRALLALTDCLGARGEPAQAREVLEEASSVLDAAGSGRAIGLLWREIAERLTDLSDLRSAALAFRRALDHGGIRDRSVATRRVVRLAGTSAGAGTAGALRSTASTVSTVSTGAALRRPPEGSPGVGEVLRSERD